MGLALCISPSCFTITHIKTSLLYSIRQYVGTRYLTLSLWPLAFGRDVLGFRTFSELHRRAGCSWRFPCPQITESCAVFVISRVSYSRCPSFFHSVDLSFSSQNTEKQNILIYNDGRERHRCNAKGTEISRRR
jgi:hypothetical protein